MNAPISQLHTHKSRFGEKAVEVSVLDDQLRDGHAGIPVLELLSALKKYHQARDFSHQERLGTPDPHSKQALKALEAVQKSLQEIAFRHGSDEQDIRIKANLSVRLSAGNS